YMTSTPPAPAAARSSSRRSAASSRSRPISPTTEIYTAGTPPTHRPAPTTHRPVPHRSGVQVSEHGEHAPVVVLVGRQPQLGEDAGRVLADCLLGDEQPLRDRRVRASLGHQ